MKHPGNIRWKLAEMLSKIQDFVVSPYDLHPAQGRNRSDKRLDVCPWWGTGYKKLFGPNLKIVFTGIDTMTKCVKYGVELSEEYPHGFDVYAKEGKK